MRLKAKLLKAFLTLGLVGAVCFLVANVLDAASTWRNSSKSQRIHSNQGRRVASVNMKDLNNLGFVRENRKDYWTRDDKSEFENTISSKTTNLDPNPVQQTLGVDDATLETKVQFSRTGNTETNCGKSKLCARTESLGQIEVNSVRQQATGKPVSGTKTSTNDEMSSVTAEQTVLQPPKDPVVSNALIKASEKEATTSQLELSSTGKKHKLDPFSSQPQQDFLDKFEIYKQQDCNIACQLRKRAKMRGGYAAKVVMEDVILPSKWIESQDLVEKLQKRRDHVKKTCHNLGLDVRSEKNLPNAWEFLSNDEHHLLWCNIFKAASSTWFYNFNLLAGFTEKELMAAKDTPISLSRKKYPRLTVEELDSLLTNSTDPPLKFIIVRHPLERLVSAFRDKLQSGSRYYRNLVRQIVKSYPNLAPSSQRQQVEDMENMFKQVSARSGKMGSKRAHFFSTRYVSPTFSQFVQYVIDSHKKGETLDEHWTPMNKFCTPCLVNFDVIAKVESLTEDGNYIIFKSGIERIIKPKKINISKDGPTDRVASGYLCQLTKSQMDDLIRIYELDLILFQYDYKKYMNCTKDNS